MNLWQLECFVEVTKQGSIKRASEQLFVAQPAVSRQIRDLEEDLGVKLFERGSRGVMLTEAGTRLYAHSTDILRKVEEARESLRHESADPRGSVSLGLPPSVSLVLTVPLVQEVKRLLPKVSLRVVEAMSGHVKDWLFHGDLDIAMLYNLANVPGLNVLPVLTEKLYLVTPSPPGPELLEYQDDPKGVPFKALEEIDLILPARPHGLREQLETKAREAGIRLHVTMEVDAFTQIKALVTRRLGVTVVSQGAVSEEVLRGELTVLPLYAPVIERTVYLASLGEKPLTAAATSVRSLMLECVKSLVADRRWVGKLSD